MRWLTKHNRALATLAALIAAAAALYTAFKPSDSKPAAPNQSAAAVGEGAKAFNAGRDLTVSEAE